MQFPTRAIGITLATTTAIGTIGGGMAARNEINNLPIESETVEWQIPVTRQTEIGRISSDFYLPGTTHNPPINDTAQTEPVHRNQPVMTDGLPYGQSQSREVLYEDTSRVFEGRGEPITTYSTENVVGYQFNGQSRSVREDYETRQVGTEIEYRNEIVDYDCLRRCSLRSPSL